MQPSAIIYTSNTGFTKKYANMLSEATGIPAVNIGEAKKSVAKGTPVIYMGWLMAGSVKDYKKAYKTWNIKAVVGVGLGPCGSQLDQVRKSIKADDNLPVFTVQGGMKREELKGINKFMINMLVKMLSSKKDATPEDKAQLDMIIKGGDFVSPENLKEVLNWWASLN